MAGRCVAAATPDVVHLLCGDALDEVVRIPVSSTAAAISMDCRVLLNEQTDGKLAAWSLDAGLESFRLRIGSPVRSIATSDRRNWLAAGTDTGVVVVALDNWNEHMRVQLPAPVTLVNASGDGRWLVVADGASVHIYDATSWRESGTTTLPEDVRWAGFDRGDRRLLIVTGKTLAVLQPGDWREQMRVDHDEHVTALQPGPDGGRLATVTQFISGGHDGGVLLTRVFEISLEPNWHGVQDRGEQQHLAGIHGRRSGATKANGDRRREGSPHCGGVLASVGTEQAERARERR